MKALLFHVTGIVQGVGFRPFVYNIAREIGVAGWVLNASDGVHILAQGDDEQLARFRDRLVGSAPPMSVIDCVDVREAAPDEQLISFEIRESVREPGEMTLVSPDIATCAACTAELSDPSDRRFHYPFTNCTNCGPRFTIIEDVPYDRPMTTMRDFVMCEDCAREYEDPADRRFHAQPNACSVCGPRLYLNLSAAEDHAGGPDLRWSESADKHHRDSALELSRVERIIGQVTSLIDDGRIMAIKGLGGFHLACDATNEEAVATLRARKNRWGKPLAVMMPDLETVKAHCQVNEAEESLLTGPVRPIVLLRRREEPGVAAGLAPGVSGRLVEIGVMLPYTPLHHILMAAVQRPLVMTSGNLSDEPIATGNQEAIERLSGVADALLLHDRDIYSRYDDSVVRVVGGIVEPVRRARGYAPHPVELPYHSDVQILAVGPEQKNTFTLVKGSKAFVSQHIGDLENADTMRSFEETLAVYRRLFRAEPEVVAHDLHPEYLSTKWALDTGLQKVGVQHHHAHVVSVAAENGVSSPVVGVAFDGTGYGEDGRIWGGEFLVADWAGYERYAHLRYVPMPGGAAAIRRPARMAVGTLHALGLLDHPGAGPLLSRLADGELANLKTMVERFVNTPLTSSMGRLFDTVAALTGIADDSGYEGEAAILLEASADTDAEGEYRFELGDSDGARELDPEPVLLGVLDDIASGVDSGCISMRFHRAVVECIVSTSKAACETAGTEDVALAGGVFMNRILLGNAFSGLAEAGLRPLTHTVLPMNDAAISLGQATVAWAWLQRSKTITA